MSSYELLKGLSDVDEKLLLPPRKFVSLRLNVLLCFLAGHLASYFETRKPFWDVIVFFCVFFLLYGLTTLLLNRNRKNQIMMIIDEKSA